MKEHMLYKFRTKEKKEEKSSLFIFVAEIKVHRLKVKASESSGMLIIFFLDPIFRFLIYFRKK